MIGRMVMVERYWVEVEETMWHWISVVRYGETVPVMILWDLRQDGKVDFHFVG